MRLILVIPLTVVFLTVGFIAGIKFNDLKNNVNGMMLSSGPELEKVQIVTNEFVEAYIKGDAEGCANTYASDAIFMVPDRSPLQGRKAIKERYESNFKNRNDSTIIKMTETVHDVIYFEDWAVMRGSGQETNDSTGNIDTYKWVILSKKTPSGKWETVWDILNDVE